LHPGRDLKAEAVEDGRGDIEQAQVAELPPLTTRLTIGLVEGGHAVAGGICNPAREEFFLGSLESGVTLNGEAARPRPCSSLTEAVVLASRSETARGEWAGFQDAPFQVQAMGSVAYKLACVAAGRAEACWTQRPKNEWDVAAGRTVATQPSPLRFNRRVPRFHSLLALGPGTEQLFAGVLAECSVLPEGSRR
jgi:hypothetical protein